jgi:hypothetical protein
MLVRLVAAETCDGFLVNADGETCQLVRLNLRVIRPPQHKSPLKIVLENESGGALEQLVPFYQLPTVFLWAPFDDSEADTVAPRKLVVLGQGERFEFPLYLAFGAPPDHLLRLDKLAEVAREQPWERTANRDLFAGCAFEARMPDYLAQHQLVYQRPVSDWMDGQVIGNGDLTAIIASHGDIDIHLTKSDLWAADRTGRALGRVPCAHLTITPGHMRADAQGSQVMSLADATVRTDCSAPGFAMRTLSWADPDSNTLITEIEGSADEASEITVVLARGFLPPPTQLTQDGASLNERQYLDFDLPRTLTATADRDCLALHYALPNLTYAVACRALVPAPDVARGLSVAGPATAPQPELRAGCDTRYSGSGVVAPGLRAGRPALNASLTLPVYGSFAFTLVTAVETRLGWDLTEDDSLSVRDSALDRVSQLTAASITDSKTRLAAHWADFWRRGPFLHLPDDPLLENLWYLSLHHVACVSRGPVAPSFLGAWWCEDLAPWNDNYVSDSQIQLDSWLAFSSGHLEFFRPFIRTFGRLMPHFMANAAGADAPGGLQVPHMFYPQHGMLNASYEPYRRHYPGSTLWTLHNFIWYYQHTGGEAYLRYFLYPALRAAARFIEQVMLERDAGGGLHVKGCSPEQPGTFTDNPFDLALVRMIYDRLLAYCAILKIDEHTHECREILASLPAYPQADGAILESAEETHPLRKHPSVFFPVYPAGEVDSRHPLALAFRRTLEIALQFWASRYDSLAADGAGWHPGGAEPNGHSLPWYSIVASRLRLPELAWDLLYSPTALLLLKPQGLFAHGGRKTHIWYKTALLDTSNAFATAINEALIQASSDGFTVFPAIREGGSARFARLMVPGPFFVSSEIVEGEVAYVVVESPLERRCRLRNPWPGQSVTIERLGGGARAHMDVGELIEFAADAGATYRISPAASAPPSTRLRLQSQARTEPWVVPLSDLVSRRRDPFFPDLLHFQQTGQPFIEHNALCLGLPGADALPVRGPNPFRPSAQEFARMWTGSAAERQAALASLTLEQSQEDVPLLTEALRDADRLVRWTAAHKLALIAEQNPRAWPPLVGLLESEEFQQRWVALTALQRVAHTTFGCDARLSPEDQRAAIGLWADWLGTARRLSPDCAG